MKRYFPLWALLGLFLIFAFPDVALADNCGSLTDCFSTQRAAVAATVGLGIFAAILSIGLDFVPVVGQVKGVIEAITGRDMITGEKLETWERAMNLVPFGAIGKVGKLGDILDAGVDLSKGLRHTDDVDELVDAGRAGRADFPTGGLRDDIGGTGSGHPRDGGRTDDDVVGGGRDTDAGSGGGRSHDDASDRPPAFNDPAGSGTGGGSKPPRDNGSGHGNRGDDGDSPVNPNDGEGGKPKVLIHKLRPGYDTHFTEVEDVVWKKGRGILGGHNLNNFEEVFTNNGWNMDDLIVSRTPHPTIDGVYEIKYQLPAKDMTGKIIEGQYKNIPFPKTVYDPNVIPDKQMLEWGRQAMANATQSANGRILTGTAPNGLMFQGYMEHGEITNFFPIIEKP